ncbi:hypothetical protein C3387_09085 [Leclercia sp. LSNIH6]|nr:hypothetical protein C3370_05175 [Leclercia sp. LSNIH7]POU78293.1 hypothetical protein C3387_09085 [Leclercia sp. LSNIH6]POW53038.1 hypothetical protein C3406_06330 [Leclercia sp. LSNIH8]
MCWIEIHSRQHIKKNYCSNMNVCVGTLKKCHTAAIGSELFCGVVGKRQDRQERVINVTQVTKYRFCKNN